MNDGLIDKIDEFTELTPSQRTRLNFKEEVYDDLIGFLRSFVRKTTVKNTLKEALENDLRNKISPMIPADGSEPDALTNYEKIRLLEILSRNDVDSNIALIKAISESAKSVENSKKKVEDEPINKQLGKDFNQKNIDDALTAIKVLAKFEKDLEKTEISEGESNKSI